MTKLALIDDDLEIRQLLCKYLTDNGYEVEAFADGESFLQENHAQFGLTILDIGLPGIDGLEVCQQLRQYCNMPIIMLTAASDDLDRILGLELGADDYMGKPFNPRELLVRIKVLFRRMELNKQETQGAICIDISSRSVIINESYLDLTGAEFDLLHVLNNRLGEVLNREEISLLIHGRKTQIFDRSIDTLVSRLRYKLNTFFEGDIIQNVRGKGYVLLSKPCKANF